MKGKNAISWFEIPATDIDRAQKFYEAIFDIKLVPNDIPQLKMRLFPFEAMDGVGGAICKTDGFHKPSASEGPLIYLNANPDLQLVLDRIENEGGNVVVRKTQISEQYGFMAVFIDSEGNRIALHSVS